MKKHTSSLKRIAIFALSALLLLSATSCDNVAFIELENNTEDTVQEDTVANTAQESTSTTEAQITTDETTAPIPNKLRFGSYNIKHGGDAGLDMSKLAKNIRAADLGIVGLQEVDQLTTRVNNINTMKRLSNHTGYDYYAFFKAIDFKGGEYGVGILSKYPILETERIELSSGKEEKRVLGRAKIDVNGLTVNFFVTHISFDHGVFIEI